MSMSRLVSKNIHAPRGRTSMRLEPEFWDALHEISRREVRCFGELVRQVESRQTEGGRTSAIRVFILQYFRNCATDADDAQAGHGQATCLPYPVRRNDPASEDRNPRLAESSNAHPGTR